MEKKELTCIGCPMGCSLVVELSDDGSSILVTGNSCPSGEKYAIKEVTNPTRILTTTVAVKGGIKPRVSIKSASDIPKGSLMECARFLKNYSINAPVHIGDVVCSNILGTGVDMIATCNVDAE